MGLLFDRMNLAAGGREITPEGYLSAKAAVTTVGIQEYMGSELLQYGFDVDSNATYGVFRGSETVFHPDTENSLKLKPITCEHPMGDVTADNYNDLSVGVVGETVERLDNKRLGAKIQITQSEIVDAVRSGVSEVSLGYDCDIIEESGTYDGQSFQFRFDGGMYINHLAVVKAGRCGETVRILDGGTQMNKKQLEKLLKAQGLTDSAIKERLKPLGKVKDDAKLTDQQIKDATLKDFDMSGLMPMLAEQLMPKMEELVMSSDFSENLAGKMASMIAGGDPGMMEQEMPGEESMEEDGMYMEKENMDAMGMKKDSKPKKKVQVMDAKAMKKAIKDAAAKRARLIDSTKNMIPEDPNVHEMSDRAILETALKDHLPEGFEVKNASDDYLMGILDSIDRDRINAQNQLINPGGENGAFAGRMPNFTDFRKMDKEV